MTQDERDSRRRSASTKEILEDLRDWSGKVLQKVKEEADTLSTRGRLTLDLSSLKSKRGTEFRKLGMKVYHLIEKGKLEIPGAGSIVEQIEGLTEEIRDRERKLKAAQKRTPPAAGDEAESDE